MEPIFPRQNVLRKVRAGVLGWICGASLGAPHQGKKDWLSLSFYTPIPKGMTPTFGTDVAALYLAEASPDEYSLCNVWHRLQRGPDAFRFAEANLRRGLRPPLSGSFENPFSKDGGAIGRAPLWGLTFAGSPGLAARWAWFDASIDHTDSGVWAASFWAAAIAAAPFQQNLAACLAVGEQILPPGSRLRSVKAAVEQARSAGKAWQEAREAALSNGQILAEDAEAAHAFALIGSLYGGADFAKATCIAAGCGGMAAEVAGAVGALVAASIGEMPDDWTTPMGDAFTWQAGESTITLFTDSILYRFLHNADSAPFRLSAEEATTSKQASQQATQQPDQSVAVEPGEQSPEQDTSFLQDVKPALPLHFVRSDVSLERVGRLIASFEYPTGAVRPLGEPLPVAFRIQNQSQDPVEIEPTVEASPGWRVAHRAKRLRLEPEATTGIAAIAQPQGQSSEGCAQPSEGWLQLKVSSRTPGNHSLEAGQEDRIIRAPLLQPQLWWVVGPFDNREQQGYEQPYGPERTTDPHAVFSGRSGQVLRWECHALQGCIFDLEPIFLRAPGVVYLTTEALFELAGRLTLIAASPVGQVVWVNEALASRYQNTHRPVPKAAPPYAVEFQGGGWVRFLVKVTRDDAPLLPTVIYFADSDGRLVLPATFRQPEAK